MKALQVLSVLCAFVLISVPGFALDDTDVQNLVFGVSPATTLICMEPGDSTNLRFLVSSNTDILQNVTIGFEGEGWAETEQYITFSNTYNLNVKISVPEGTEEGPYDINMLLCSHLKGSTEKVTSTEACLTAQIDIDVTNLCMTETPIDRNILDNIKIFLLLAIIILTGIFLLRQVGNIKSRKKH